MSLGVCYCGAYGGGRHTLSARCKAVPPAIVTDLQRLDSRLSDAAYRLKQANEQLHRCEVAHREASEAVDAELARLASGGTVDGR
jgi:hypothetical protein